MSLCRTSSHLKNHPARLPSTLIQVKWTPCRHGGWSGNILLVRDQIVLNTPPLFITQATPLEVVSGFIVQLIVHLSLVPSVWNRMGPMQVFMANLIYGVKTLQSGPRHIYRHRSLGSRSGKWHMYPFICTYINMCMQHMQCLQNKLYNSW